MKLISSCFSIPKKGSLPKENEDFYFPLGREIKRSHQSVAIADGASEGFLSKLWSKILTISYVAFDRTDLDMRLFTDFCIGVYNYQRDTYVKKRKESDNPLISLTRPLQEDTGGPILLVIPVFFSFEII